MQTDKLHRGRVCSFCYKYSTVVCPIDEQQQQQQQEQQQQNNKAKQTTPITLSNDMSSYAITGASRGIGVSTS
jgi:hypothetical protein